MFHLKKERITTMSMTMFVALSAMMVATAILCDNMIERK